MATKDYSSSSKGDHRNSSSIRGSPSSNLDSQYNNLNLNANLSSPKVDTVISKSVLNENRSAFTKVPDYSHANFDNQNKSRNNSSLWSPGCKDSSSYTSDYQKPEERFKNGTNEMKDSSNKSTLSLHIAAYENSTEAAAAYEDERDEQDKSDEPDVKKAKKGKFNRAMKSVKTFFTGSTPKDSETQNSEDSSTPEIMKFKQSQKLLNVKEPGAANGAKDLLGGHKSMLSMDKADSSTLKTSLPSSTHSSSDLAARLLSSNKSTVTRQALGHVALLGELYDGHRDVFCEHSAFNETVGDLVNSVESNQIISEYILDNSMNGKFQRLGINGGLKLSVLSGMVKDDGEHKRSAPLITDGNESIASAVFRVISRNESIDINSPALLNAVSSEAVSNFSSATHVITGIQWGTRVFVDLIYKHQNGDTQESIDEKFKLAFGQLEKSFIGADTNSEGNSFENLRLHFQIDTLPDYDNGPKSFKEAAAFIRKLPQLKQGQVNPISYSMTPITFFTQNLNIRERIVYDVDEKVVEEVVKIFDGMRQSLKALTWFSQHIYCLEDRIGQIINEKHQRFKAANAETRKQLQKTLIEVRCGKKMSDAIIEIFQSYCCSDLASEAITTFCNQLLTFREKIDFIQNLAKNDAIYVGRETSMETERKKLKLDECYEFYCDWSNEKNLAENLSIFLELGLDGTKLAFVDLQVNPFARNANVIPDGNRICQFLNGRYLDTDCLQKWSLDQSKSWVKCMKRKQFSGDKPKKRIDVKLPCPLSFKENGEGCENAEQVWYCADCEQQLQYDFKNHFYCRCGIAPVGDYQFRCFDPKHADSFVTFEENQLTALIDEIRPNKEINILLLGETGVGKSTWINSFANYLTHSTLAEAEKANPISLIPSQFTSTMLVDGKYQGKTIKIGESKNENFQKGESSTQDPQSHVFTVGNKTIRIIDTPGIGDTRGVVTDKENFASILQFISQFDEIHGICVLLKPNNSRLTLVFKYCINELLAHLHKSAADNIAFCFTNARNSFYRPGDTWPILERYVNELFDNQKVRIELNHETIYCLDNEAFRFICLLNNGGEFSSDERTNFDKSWEMSVKETQRLLNHFENDVKPHVVSETVSLNEARKIILTAAKPLADITKNIQQNIKSIDRQRNEIQQADAYELKLRGTLMINHIGIRTQPLGYPRTVCSAASCTETKRLPNTESSQVIYKTVCHEHCYIENVVPEIAPNPALQKCHAMNGNLSCNECGCRWDTHLHITFEQEEIEEEVEDENVRRSIAQNKSAKEVQQDAIKALEKRIDEYKNSQADIDRILAKFASFLKKNAILAYNDTIEDYLKLNIRDEKEQRDPNPELLKKMEEQLEQYREEKRILDSRLASGEAEHVKPGDIKVLQRELENLPLVGKDFKMLFDAHVRGAQSNLHYGEQYYDPYYHTILPKRHHGMKNKRAPPSLRQNKPQMNYLNAAKRGWGDFCDYFF